MRPESSAAREARPVVMARGTTVSGVAFQVYGQHSALVMHLIQEANPGIEDLNWVVAGQTLRLPPLTRETLLRRQLDGSHRLILSAFDSLPDAEGLASDVRLGGYQTTITPKRISPGTSLHRVEIVGLDSAESISRAWATAVSRRWLRLPPRPTGRDER